MAGKGTASILMILHIFTLEIGYMSGQTLMEAVGSGENYAALTALTPLTDASTSTCIDFKPYWTFRPMATIRNDWSGADSFTVTVNLGAEIESKRTNILRVFTTSTGLETATTFPGSASYKKCSVSETDTSDFDCACTAPCSYFVQLVYDEIADVDTAKVDLCEVSVA